PRLRDGLVAPDAAEDEEDRRKQLLSIQQTDRLGPVEARSHARRARRASVPAAAPRRSAIGRETAPHPQQLRVDARLAGAGPLIEEGQELAAREHMLLQRNRSR